MTQAGGCAYKRTARERGHSACGLRSARKRKRRGNSHFVQRGIAAVVKSATRSATQVRAPTSIAIVWTYAGLCFGVCASQPRCRTGCVGSLDVSVCRDGSRGVGGRPDPHDCGS
jgi:hypothetical protein